MEDHPKTNTDRHMPIKIIMISSDFYPHFSGAEKQCLLLSQRLIELGIKVLVLTKKIPHNPEYEEIDGVPVFRKIRTINLGSLWGIAYLLSTFWFLIRYRNQYDVIHCHQLGLDTVASILVKAILRKKVVVKIACAGEYGDLFILKQLALSKLMLKVVKKADKFIAISNTIIDELKANNFPESKIIKIPNAVDCRYFQPDKNQSHKAILTFVGRLTKQKGIEYLIRAFYSLINSSSKYPDVLLFLLGKGDLEGQLRDEVKSLSLADRVYFIGHTEDVLKYYHDTSIFILPSLAEGMSNSLLEAMACGLPVIATRIGGNTDLITDGENGLLVSPGNSKELSIAITRLLEDKNLALRMGQQARKQIEATYSFEKVSIRYIKLYEELLKQP
jgi:glycosyltransferase involved in cell wall biosynthesis